MSDSGEKGHWSESSDEKADSAEGEEDQAMDTREHGNEEEGDDGEEEEDDVDSATYEAELEQEIDEAEVQEEVDKLQEESECPIEELIALYGLPAGSAAAGSAPPAAPAAPAPAAVASPSGRRTRARRRAPEPERGPPPTSRRRLDSPGTLTAGGNADEETSTELGPSSGDGGAPVEDDDEDERLYSRMFGGEAEDDDDNDEDFDPGLPLDEKKARLMSLGYYPRPIVQIGDAHQAHVPTGLSPYPELERHKHDLSMVWDPSKLGNDSVERYLMRMYKDDLSPMETDPTPAAGSGSSTTSGRSESSKHRVPDDENLLFLLQRCNYDMNEAFRRRKCQNIDEKAFPDYMSLWTEEEVTNFERGILHYGKNFHLIHAHKVCKRDVPQLVEFYYWWKKSARYENFVRAFKLDRRVPTQSSGAGLGLASGQAGLEACAEEEEGQADGVLPHLNGGAGLAGESGEFMECLVDEQEFISGNYEESAAAVSSPPQSSVLSNSDAATGDLDKNSVSADQQPAFKPWDQHREKFDYEMPRRAACTVPRQKSPSKGSSRPKRASIMACL